MNVISYSLFRGDPQEVAVDHKHTYLLGLLLNIQQRQKLLPNWQIWVYASSEYKNSPVLAYAKEHCRIIWKKPGKHWENVMWRYTPFFDSSVAACIVRDIDSILQDLDALHVKQWLEKPDKVLLYTEYQMSGRAMGGGIGYKGTLTKPAFQHWNKRGIDETFLELLPQAKPTLVTRMDGIGRYYEYCEGKEPEECRVVFGHADHINLSGKGFRVLCSLLHKDTSVDLPNNKELRPWVR